MDVYPDLTLFNFNGTTFVVEVNGKEFPREDSRSLYGLLTHQEPDSGGVVTKAGAVQSSTFKDKSVDFYRAQLLHYACRDRKTKDAAKKELLKAFGDKKRLPIPPDLIAYEKELKDRYRLETGRNDTDMTKKRKANDVNVAGGSGVKPAMSRNQLLKEIAELPKDQLREFFQNMFDDNAGLEARCVNYFTQNGNKRVKTVNKASSSKVICIQSQPVCLI